MFKGDKIKMINCLCGNEMKVSDLSILVNIDEKDI